MATRGDANAKVELRALMKARRAALSVERRAAQSAKLATTAVATLGITSGQAVSAFLSIGDELDTGPLLAALHSAGARLSLPVMQGKGRPLIFRTYAPGDDLDVVVWDIREPKADRPEIEPSLMLVPLLAFDTEGWRLGYGGGFYDRTIREARAKRALTTIGLGFDEQKVDAVPHLDYDEPLDGVLTPSGLTRCR